MYCRYWVLITLDLSPGFHSLERSIHAFNIRGVARRLFKSRYDMIDERSLGVKVPVESKDSALEEGPKERERGVT